MRSVESRNEIDRVALQMGNETIESRPVEIALGKGKLYILCRSMPSTAHYAAVCRSSILCRNIMPASDRKPKFVCELQMYVDLYVSFECM